MHALQGDAEAFEHASGDALTLAQQTHQQMLGPNLGGLLCLRLFLSKVQRTAGGSAERRLDQQRAATLADHEIQRLAQPHRIDAQPGDDEVYILIVRLEQPVEQMLGADGLVIEPERNLPCLRQRSSRVTIVAVKAAHDSLTPCCGPCCGATRACSGMLLEHVSSENERKEHATSGMRALELERNCHFEALEGAKQHVTDSIPASSPVTLTSSDARRVFLVGVHRAPIQTWRQGQAYPINVAHLLCRHKLLRGAR